MSPIIMDLPPTAIGHNSQACEVRPAQVSKVNSDRNAFLDMAVQDGIDERQRILHYAAAYMGHAQFHTFYLMMHHGSKYGDGVTVGQRRIAGIMECSERHVRRIMDELEGDGWFERREKRRDARAGKIPDALMQPLIAELVERSKVSGQGIVVPAAMVPQHVDRTPTSNRTPMSGSTSSNRTPMSGSQTAPEPRTGHSWPNEPDIPVHITKEDKPNAPESAPARICARIDPPNWEMNAALNFEERKAQTRIWRTDGGGLAISPELRAELGRDFPLVPIDETLRIVKTESNLKDNAKKLLLDVERKFAYAQRDEAGRDRRYAARAPSPMAKTSSPSWRYEQTKGRPGR